LLPDFKILIPHLPLIVKDTIRNLSGHLKKSSPKKKQLCKQKEQSAAKFCQNQQHISKSKTFFTTFFAVLHDILNYKRLFLWFLCNVEKLCTKKLLVKMK
jgi:hypothetical protein